MEIWKSVPGYEGFVECSDQGRFRRIRIKGSTCCKLIKVHVGRAGYSRAYLFNGSKQTAHLAHRLVWAAFKGSIPDGMQVNHLNGIKTDNRLDNLEVCTASQNQLHSRNVLGNTFKIPPAQVGEMNVKAKLKEADLPEIWRLRESGLSQQAIANIYGVNQTSISGVLLGRTWKHYKSAVEL